METYTLSRENTEALVEITTTVYTFSDGTVWTEYLESFPAPDGPRHFRRVFKSVNGEPTWPSRGEFLDAAIEAATPTQGGKQWQRGRRSPSI